MDIYLHINSSCNTIWRVLCQVTNTRSSPMQNVNHNNNQGHSEYGRGQLKTMLQRNVVSHWRSLYCVKKVKKNP